MLTAKMLLFNFSNLEREQWKKLTPPGIELMSVPKSAYGLRVQEVLKGETAGPAAQDFFHKMLFLSDVPDPLVHYLLNVCRQVTGDPVLKAMATETNLQWSCRELFEHILEEDRQMH
jgi:hypothetical protein